MPTSLVQQSLFDYGSVPEQDRTFLREQEDAIVRFCRRTLADLVSVGEALLAVQNRIPRHTFKAWLAAKTPISRTTAYRLISVAMQFKQHVLSHGEAQTKAIDPTALYALAEPSVRPAARLEALEKAAAGEEITLSVARELIAKAKPQVAPQRTLLPDEPEPEPVDTRSSQAIAALEQYAKLCTFLNITVMEDQDPEADTLYVIQAAPKSGPRKQGVGRGLIEAVESLAGSEPSKTCSRCGLLRPLRFFTAKSSHTDGHASECRECSRKRVREAKQDRKFREGQAA